MYPAFPVGRYGALPWRNYFSNHSAAKDSQSILENVRIFYKMCVYRFSESPKPARLLRWYENCLPVARYAAELITVTPAVCLGRVRNAFGSKKMKSTIHNNQFPIAVFVLITVLNIGLVINFLMPNINGTGFALSGIQVYALAGLELAAVIITYTLSKRRATSVSF
jgi:uncharacterized membrane protein